VEIDPSGRKFLQPEARAIGIPSSDDEGRGHERTALAGRRVTEEAERREDERHDRRRAERRRSRLAIFIERRLRDRRLLPRRLVDVFRSFLGLPPSE
jgi:hypothetical protein